MIYQWNAIYHFSFFTQPLFEIIVLKKGSQPHPGSSVLWQRLTGVPLKCKSLSHLPRGVGQLKLITIGGVRTGLIPFVCAGCAVLGLQFHIQKRLYQKLNELCNLADLDQMSELKRFRMSCVWDSGNLPPPAGTTDTGMKTTLRSQCLIHTNVFMFSWKK